MSSLYYSMFVYGYILHSVYAFILYMFDTQSVMYANVLLSIVNLYRKIKEINVLFTYYVVCITLL